MNQNEQINQLMQKLQDIEFALSESSIVAITNKQGIITSVNDKFCEISKYTEEELIGSYHNIINSGYHSNQFFKNMWKTIGNGEVWKGEIKNKAKDGTYYWVDTTIVPFLNEDGKPYQYVAIRHEITKLKEYEERIRKIAYYDPLTSLANRNMINEWLEKRQNNMQERIAALVIDIDRFKSINDNFSHDTGDLILKQIASRLSGTVSHDNLLIREGADKFILFLANIDTQDDVMYMVNTIKEQMSVPFHVNQHRIILTISIGISMNDIVYDRKSEFDLLNQTIQQADTAMYHAKLQFGNTHCFNTQAQNVELERYRQLEIELRTALSENQFKVVYQPIVNLKTNKVTGVEALLRWHHPKLGMVSPVEFIPILEEIGLIIPVGNWIIHTVSKQLKYWQDKGLDIPKVTINASPIQFQDPHFLKNITSILESNEIDAKHIELEITEGTIINIANPKETLDEFRNMGLRISIDDFGTGYSSLSYLKKLPIHTLKIDRSFISELDKQDEMIVQTIVNLGQNLNFEIIAEGIETMEQLAYLRSLDCHEGQGYYWSKPVESEEIERLYEEQNVIN
ncbi:MAG TPA: EAL domain-containing protein [Pseudogracilibacillus sp.]|nr:EAL domain-containing protein [Pseudogracilibacillus sp.]